jgi:hypothetical protein
VEAVRQISVTKFPEKTWAQGFEDQALPHNSLHDLYWALIVAHGERVRWPLKCGLTRKCSHAGSLLIMGVSNLSVVGSIPTGGAKLARLGARRLAIQQA